MFVISPQEVSDLSNQYLYRSIFIVDTLGINVFEKRLLKSLCENSIFTLKKFLKIVIITQDSRQGFDTFLSLF